MSDISSEPKSQKIAKPKLQSLRSFDVSYLTKLYADAKNKTDQKTMRRINYELRARGLSIRRYSSVIRAHQCTLPRE